MRARPRDFIHTSDDMFFATTTYLHPEDRIISFLRYIPDEEGDRYLNDTRYSKVDSKQAYDFLEKNYPEYLFDCEITNVQMMGVPINKVETILKPTERLNEIRNSQSRDSLLEKVVKLAGIFHKNAGISYDKMGISGSILPNLYNPSSSDIDFVIYGLENHKNAMRTFKTLKDNESSSLKSIGEEYWKKLYEKRIKDSSLTYNEFRWYENRKNNRGVIDGTLFDLLQTRDWDEITGTYGTVRYEPLGMAKIECTVKDSLAAFDNPALYKVEDVKIIEGPNVPIEEVASYTHTYSGQAKNNERVAVRGKLERVIGKTVSYRVIVGTTRESIGEYIKLVNLKLV